MLEKFQIIRYNYSIGESYLYSCDATNVYQKIEIITTKVSKDDFYLVDIS